MYKPKHTIPIQVQTFSKLKRITKISRRNKTSQTRNIAPLFANPNLMKPIIYFVYYFYEFRITQRPTRNIINKILQCFMYCSLSIFCSFHPLNLSFDQSLNPIPPTFFFISVSTSSKDTKKEPVRVAISESKPISSLNSPDSSFSLSTPP